MKNIIQDGIELRPDFRRDHDISLMVGLHAGTHSKAVVLGGILTIAVADALSDVRRGRPEAEAKSRGPVDLWNRSLWEL